jgi:uncharacterized protein YyaL (SSP411 family)
MANNRLADQTSPYLLQHADNPVDWQPWGPEALEKAKAKNKPILLSVGYAACHWCHVMAHESFENKDIAAQMNELFVNIKVDREERPDLDTIYQHALQLLGQQGGWPLTMFLTPNGEPFWGGTYFPPKSKYGRPGFPDVLNTIHGYWTDKKDSISENVSTLRESLSEMALSESGGEVELDVVERAAQRLAQEYDTVNGGIGTAPKFPNPSILELLWRTHKRCGQEDLKQIVLLTLEKMCQGGIYDHLGGGFSRYSTDAIWLAPHFEKMLYDNAQLLDLLTWAWQETKEPLFKLRAQETVDWVLREMIAEGGGFAATLDADSEGEEGKFYVWNQTEIESILEQHAPLFIEAYDVHAAGNWEGKTILNRTNNDRPYSAQEEEILAGCRDQLFAERKNRIHPGWDDKVLADWNGLMIAAMAHAGTAFNQGEWVDAAQRAFDFVSKTMSENGKLYHAYRDGKVNHAATLDDYTGMIRAAIALYEITGAPNCLAAAEGWVNVVNDQFWDSEDGGYFFTADDAEALIVRTKSAADNATPAGNSVMVANLARLYYLTGNAAYRDRADQTTTAFSGELDKNFFPFTALMNSAELLQRGVQIAIIGDREDPDYEALLRAICDVNVMNKIVSVIPPTGSLPDNHPASGKAQSADTATAYVCVGMTCSLPITDPEALTSYLKTTA